MSYFNGLAVVSAAGQNPCLSDNFGLCRQIVEIMFISANLGSAIIRIIGILNACDRRVGKVFKSAYFHGLTDMNTADQMSVAFATISVCTGKLVTDILLARIWVVP